MINDLMRDMANKKIDACSQMIDYLEGLKEHDLSPVVKDGYDRDDFPRELLDVIFEFGWEYPEIDGLTADDFRNYRRSHEFVLTTI